MNMCLGAYMFIHIIREKEWILRNSKRDKKKNFQIYI